MEQIRKAHYSHRQDFIASTCVLCYAQGNTGDIEKECPAADDKREAHDINRASIVADGIPGRHTHIWRFEDAPRAFTILSNSGGDEDWVALVPSVYADAYLPWLDDQVNYGVQTVELLNGFQVKIVGH